MEDMNDWFVVQLVDGKRIRCKMHMENHSKSGMFPFRIEMFWNKTSDSAYDIDMTNKLEEELSVIMQSDNDAFLIAVTEDDSQFIFTWYSRSVEKFGELFNKAMMFYPRLPIELISTDDPEWSAYNHLLSYMKNS